AHRADASVLPGADDGVAAVGLDARYLLAARPEQRVQHLDGVDAVPEQIRMVWLEVLGAERERAADSAVLVALPQRLHVADEAQARRAEERHARFAREPHDLARIGVAGGHRLVDEDALLRREDGARLIQMRPAVHAFQQYRIHSRAQRLD